MSAAARKAFDEAIALETSGQVDKALVSYLKAQELSPDDAEIAYRTACALLQNGYLDEAQSQLRRLVFSEPDHVAARASLGNCQLLLEDFGNAEQNFAEVLARAPGNLNALYGFATVLLRQNRPAEAYEPAKQLVELLPDSAASLSLFAETLSKADQMPAAIAAYRKALKSDPNFGPALTGLSQTLLLRKRYDEIIELSLRACNNAPADPLPLELLSDALQGKGSLEDAVEAAEAALKLNPRSVTNLVRLSGLFRKRSDHKTALKHALAAHDLDEGSKEPFNALGAALAAMKYPLQARSVLTSISAANGLEPAIRKLIEELTANDSEAAETLPVSVQKSIQPADESTQSAVSAAADSLPGTEQSQTGVNALLSADDEQLPNVLGLRRQDRT